MNSLNFGIKQGIPIIKICGIKLSKNLEIYMKYLVILILLFDGTLIQEKLPFNRVVEVHECLMYGDEHREVIATYKEFKDSMKNGWYLNDGRGTIQGFMCE